MPSPRALPLLIVTLVAGCGGARAGTGGEGLAPGAAAGRSTAETAVDSVVPTSAFTGDTLEWVVSAAGRAVGRMRQWGDTGLTTVTTLSLRAGERAPAWRHVVRVDRAGLPVTMAVTGTDPVGAPRTETLAIDKGVATWRTETGVGRAAATRAVFRPTARVPEDDALLARAILASKQKSIPLLPAGTATLATVGARTVRGAELTVTTTLHLLLGVDLRPIPVWLDPSGRLFASLVDGPAVVRRGFERVLPELRAAQDSALLARDSAQFRTVAVRPAATLVIRRARLFDPRSRRVTPGTAIVVRGDRITSIERDSGFVAPAGATVVDARDQLVLPGLWDLQGQVADGDGALHLAAGVTSVRAVAATTFDVAGTSARGERWAAGVVPGPRLHLVEGDALVAGPSVLADLLGDSVPAARGPARQLAIARLGGTVDVQGDATAALVSRLRERRTVVVPTLARYETLLTTPPGQLPVGLAPVAEQLPPVVRAALRGGGLPVTSPAERRRFQASFTTMQRLAKRLYDAEVPLAVATSDALPGATLHRELELLAQAGIPNGDVLHAATLGAATLLGRDSVEGRIAPGMRADLVIVDGDPLQVMAALRRTTLVVKDGIVWRPDRLHAALGITPTVPSLAVTLAKAGARTPGARPGQTPARGRPRAAPATRGTRTTRRPAAPPR